MENQHIKPFYQGKVRDLYDCQQNPNTMVIVASDRVSAFDVIMKEQLPDKGKILTRVSNHWFSLLLSPQFQQNVSTFKSHLLATDSKHFPIEFASKQQEWAERAVWVKKAKRIDFECVVRGYIIGSGWKEYQQTGEVCGIKLPSGLKMAQKLNEPIFTPATKAESGHDENISFDFMAHKIGTQLSQKLKDISLSIYNFALGKLLEQGIILADTKFEFGLDEQGDIVLIDEALTPDSSRFWDAEQYKEGSSPASFDKQILRDFLETTQWDKTPPPPNLTPQIIEKSIDRYRQMEQKVLSIKI